MNYLVYLVLLVVISFAGCASEPAFDPKATFAKGEEQMQNEDYEEARKEYQSIQEKSPEKAYDPVLMLRIADTYFGEKKYAEAQVEYQAFLNYHPVHRDSAYAQYQIAMCSYKELTSIDRDPTPAHNVIKEMRKLKSKYPRTSYAEEADKYIDICLDRLAKYELYVVKFYYKKDAYKAVASRCERILKTYPGSSVEKDALHYAALSYEELGEKTKAIEKYELLGRQFMDMKKTAAEHIQKLQK